MSSNIQQLHYGPPFYGSVGDTYPSPGPCPRNFIDICPAPADAASLFSVAKNANKTRFLGPRPPTRTGQAIGLSSSIEVQIKAQYLIENYREIAGNILEPLYEYSQLYYYFDAFDILADGAYHLFNVIGRIATINELQRMDIESTVERWASLNKTKFISTVKTHDPIDDLSESDRDWFGIEHFESKDLKILALALKNLRKKHQLQVEVIRQCTLKNPPICESVSAQAFRPAQGSCRKSSESSRNLETAASVRHRVCLRDPPNDLELATGQQRSIRNFPNDFSVSPSSYNNQRSIKLLSSVETSDHQNNTIVSSIGQSIQPSRHPFQRANTSTNKQFRFPSNDARVTITGYLPLHSNDTRVFNTTHPPSSKYTGVSVPGHTPSNLNNGKVASSRYPPHPPKGTRASFEKYPPFSSNKTKASSSKSPPSSLTDDKTAFIPSPCSDSDVRKIWVTGFEHRDKMENYLRGVFSQFGEVVRVTVRDTKYLNTGRLCDLFAFVEFTAAEFAEQTIELFKAGHSKVPLTVQKANFKPYTVPDIHQSRGGSRYRQSSGSLSRSGNQKPVKRPQQPPSLSWDIEGQHSLSPKFGENHGFYNESTLVGSDGHAGSPTKDQRNARAFTDNPRIVNKGRQNAFNKKGKNSNSAEVKQQEQSTTSFEKFFGKMSPTSKLPKPLKMTLLGVDGDSISPQIRQESLTPNATKVVAISLNKSKESKKSMPGPKVESQCSAEEKDHSPLKSGSDKVNSEPPGKERNSVEKLPRGLGKSPWDNFIPLATMHTPKEFSSDSSRYGPTTHGHNKANDSSLSRNLTRNFVFVQREFQEKDKSTMNRYLKQPKTTSPRIAGNYSTEQMPQKTSTLEQNVVNHMCLEKTPPMKTGILEEETQDKGRHNKEESLGSPRTPVQKKVKTNTSSELNLESPSRQNHKDVDTKSSTRSTITKANFRENNKSMQSETHSKSVNLKENQRPLSATSMSDTSQWPALGRNSTKSEAKMEQAVAQSMIKPLAERQNRSIRSDSKTSNPYASSVDSSPQQQAWYVAPGTDAHSPHPI